MGIDFDGLGDKHKEYEAVQAGVKLIPGVPVLVRLDGRAFHTLTRNAVKPFDDRFVDSMQYACKKLVETLHASVGYTQSDEITLIWMEPIMFDGKIQKWCSVFASACTFHFNKYISTTDFPVGDMTPMFDCRVWQVPNLTIAAENLLWREMDASRNSVSMTAHAQFGHKKLHGVSTKNKIAMLEEAGIHWNLFPDHHKRGAYFKRRTVECMLSAEELSRIPEQHRPSGPVQRGETQQMVGLPPATTVINWADVIFFDATPVRRLDTPCEAI